MKFEDVKKWLPLLLIGVPAIWLGLYFWAWMARVGCGNTLLGKCLVESLGSWGADVVMLQWVKGHQTLLAGAFAVFAGGFVILAAVYQNNADQRQRRMDRAEELKAKFALLEYAYGGLVTGMTNDIARVASKLDMIEDMSLSLALKAPAASHFTLFVMSELRGRLDRRQAKIPVKDLSYCARVAAIASDYFSGIGDCVRQDGTFVWAPQSLAANTIQFLESEGPIDVYSVLLHEHFEGY